MTGHEARARLREVRELLVKIRSASSDSRFGLADCRTLAERGIALCDRPAALAQGKLPLSRKGRE